MLNILKFLVLFFVFWDIFGGITSNFKDFTRAEVVTKLELKKDSFYTTENNK